MISKIEKERKEILDQLNNQGRLLEKGHPQLATKLNAGLRKLLDDIRRELL